MDHRLAMSAIVFGLAAPNRSTSMIQVSSIPAFPDYPSHERVGCRPLKAIIIAIDGPAAAGKGTLAVALAQNLGLPHLDTGLLYRVVGRLMLMKGRDCACDDASDIAASLQTSDLKRTDLRLPEVDRAASLVAAQPAVRAALLQRQRDFAAAHGAVMDGRDIGTAVFPDADIKLFVTASAHARALRRYQQYHDHDPSAAEISQMEAEIEARATISTPRAASRLYGGLTMRS